MLGSKTSCFMFQISVENYHPVWSGKEDGSPLVLHIWPDFIAPPPLKASPMNIRAAFICNSPPKNVPPFFHGMKVFLI